MTTATYTIQDFVREAQRIVDRGDSAERTIAAISGGLERIINRPDCLTDLPGRNDPNPDEGFSIHRSDNLTINAVVWAPDSGAPIHNHNGWAMEGVISGIELNRNFDRTDDGAIPWYATLEERDPHARAAGRDHLPARAALGHPRGGDPARQDRRDPRLWARPLHAVALPLRPRNRQGHAVRHARPRLSHALTHELRGRHRHGQARR